MNNPVLIKHSLLTYIIIVVSSRKWGVVCDRYSFLCGKKFWYEAKRLPKNMGYVSM